LKRLLEHQYSRFLELGESVATWGLAQFRIEGVLLCGDSHDHELQIRGSVGDEGVRFIEADWNRIAFVNGCGFRTHLNLTVSVEDVIDLFDTTMTV
jgi:hypothetical protein